MNEGIIKKNCGININTCDVKQLGSMAEHVTSIRENPNQYRVYDPNYVSPTLTSMGGGWENAVYCRDNKNAKE